MNTLKIDWNKDSKENARYILTDGASTHYVSEEQIDAGDGEICGMRAVADAFQRGYDHAESDEPAECRITDVTDGETRRFRFERDGNFQWDIRANEIPNQPYRGAHSFRLC